MAQGSLGSGSIFFFPQGTGEVFVETVKDVSFRYNLYLSHRGELIHNLTPLESLRLMFVWMQV